MRLSLIHIFSGEGVSSVWLESGFAVVSLLSFAVHAVSNERIITAASVNVSKRFFINPPVSSNSFSYLLYVGREKA